MRVVGFSGLENNFCEFKVKFVLRVRERETVKLERSVKLPQRKVIRRDTIYFSWSNLVVARIYVRVNV